ncbi:hypothetical protein OHB49_44055 (plasmid) [Streptomyces sp. NBC_01717]|uniref:hypothetical protein n=1 Tax=Streptomyces sp. NBC_01717 TaxID=2975918 RepID=UPI002E35F50A|nr:hypothetical protein [Streptomyces sp. NBC_01717]
MRRLEAATGQKNGKGIGCAIALMLLVGLFISAQYGVVLLITVIAIIVTPHARVSAARGAAQRRRERLWSDHQQMVEHWRRLVAEHEAQHRLRSAEIDLWYPLRLESRPSRIDVFGGTGNGWASLLATVGGPLLGSGQAVPGRAEQGVTSQTARPVRRAATLRQLKCPAIHIRCHATTTTGPVLAGGQRRAGPVVDLDEVGGDKAVVVRFAPGR